MNHICSEGSFPFKQNDSNCFFTLQRHAVRDFRCVKLNALSLRTLTFGEEVLRFQ